MVPKFPRYVNQAAKELYVQSQQATTLKRRYSLINRNKENSTLQIEGFLFLYLAFSVSLSYR